MKRYLTYRNGAYLLFAALFGLALLTYPDYGIPWDEALHVTYGQTILDYYQGWLNGTPDLTAVSYRNLYWYGGSYDLFVTLTTRLLRHLAPPGEMEQRHLVNALVGILGVIGAWRTARLLAGERAAFWAAVLLALTPVYYGHMFFNPKDIPFAVGYIWSLCFLVRLLGDFPQVRWGSLAKFGLAAGITTGIRIGGVFLFGYLGLALLWNFWQVWRSRKPLGWKSILRLVVLPAGFSGLIAYVVMLAGWPYAQQDPLRSPIQALLQMGRFDWQYGVLYRGEYVSAGFLPVDYIFRYLAISLPELVIALLLAGTLLAIIDWRRRRVSRGALSGLALGMILLVGAVFIPILTAILLRSTVYDGIRHFLFVVPPLACLAGISLHFILDRLAAWKPKSAVLVSLVVGVCMIYQVFILARLHPYEFIYYNSLVGGPARAYRDYETDYWGTAVSEAAQRLVSYLEDQGRSGGEPVQVFVAGANEFSAHYYFPDWVEFTPAVTGAEYFIGGIRSFAMDQLPGVELFTVTRMGVPLATVKDLKP